MPAKKLSPLERARKEAPAQDRGRKSKLDKPEIQELIHDWLKSKAAGKCGNETFAWFATEVLTRMSIDTTDGNLRRYCQTRWPELYARANR